MKSLLLISWLLVIISTAQTQAETFILLGDTGKNSQGQRLVAEALQKECAQDCQRIFLLGDNVYPEGITSADDPQMKKMFEDYYSSLKVNFQVVLGNHDYGKLSNDWPRGQAQVQYAKKNSQFLLPSEYYSFETADLVVAALDTSRLMWNKDYDAQVKLVQEAQRRAQSSGKWFVVMGHHPYISNGKHGNAGRYEGVPILPPAASGKYFKKFMDAHVCGKAQLYFSGHDHNLQLLDANQKGCDLLQVVSGSGGSTEDWREKNQPLFAALELGYGKLITAPNQLVLIFKNEKGTELYRTEISK